MLRLFMATGATLQPGENAKCKMEKCLITQGSYRRIPDSNGSSCCAACIEDTRCAGWTCDHAGLCQLKQSSEYIITVYKSGLFCGRVRNTTLPPTPAPPPAPAGAKNVMLIVADDMNADLPMYGNHIVHAPNLQRIADSGVTFNQAHVQIAYCCPSRNSFMSGRRPDTTRVWTFLTNWRQASLSNSSTPGASEAWIDLPQWFKRNGYWTTGVGKTWHNAIGYNPNTDWSDLGNFPVQFDVTDGTNPLFDINNTDVTVSRIKYAASLNKPFFITHGFIRPHLPWVYPPELKRDFYPEYANGSQVVPSATHPRFPVGTTPIAWHQCAEMAVGSFSDPFPPAATSARRLEYFCAITYVDQQIGRLLDALDESNLTQTTAILFLGSGDHGWQTGQKNMWCKMSVFDLATRIPFLISAPWVAGGAGAGKRTEAFAEAVDIFATLADLAGIPVPAAQGLQGRSLAPVLADPEGAGAEAVHAAALSQFPRCWQNETRVNGGRKCGDENNKTNSEYNMCDCHWAPAEFIAFMGYSMRVATPFPLRYTEWVRWNVTHPDWSSVFARELYNHTGDTGNHVLAENFENENIAGHVGNEALVRALSKRLHSEFDQCILR